MHAISMEIVLMEFATAFLDFMATIAVDVSSVIQHYFNLRVNFASVFLVFSLPLIAVVS